MRNARRSWKLETYWDWDGARSSGWTPAIHPFPSSSSRALPRNSSQVRLNQSQLRSTPDVQIITGAFSARRRKRRSLPPGERSNQRCSSDSSALTHVPSAPPGQKRPRAIRRDGAAAWRLPQKIIATWRGNARPSGARGGSPKIGGSCLERKRGPLAGISHLGNIVDGAARRCSGCMDRRSIPGPASGSPSARRSWRTWRQDLFAIAARSRIHVLLHVAADRGARPGVVSIFPKNLSGDRPKH